MPLAWKTNNRGKLNLEGITRSRRSKGFIRLTSLHDLAAFNPTPVPFLPIRRFTRMWIDTSISTFLIRGPALPINAAQYFIGGPYFFSLQQGPDRLECGQSLRDRLFTSVKHEISFQHCCYAFTAQLHPGTNELRSSQETLAALLRSRDQFIPSMTPVQAINYQPVPSLTPHIYKIALSS